ncbi:hypothetical protein Tco_0252870 [Tanacetum coccineum]
MAGLPCNKFRRDNGKIIPFLMLASSSKVGTSRMQNFGFNFLVIISQFIHVNSDSAVPAKKSVDLFERH